jgi:uncharacterized protein (TIGR01777 family)
MKVVIAGGTGFLGRPLGDALVGAGHEVIVLTRARAAGSDVVRQVTWTPDGTTGPWTMAIDGADAVVNLAGAGLADRRWTTSRKHVLRDSRILATRSLVAAMRIVTTPPATFLSGSAVGYYGSRGAEPLDESARAGRDFLARLCSDWEAEALSAVSRGCRVLLIRTGVVLAREGGALRKLIPPFLMFAGGPIASGLQVMSWIHRDDWIALVVWALNARTASGALNATAPTPVTNAEFCRALGQALHRPSWLRVPTGALRLLVGEIADVALVSGQRVLPTKALAAGFTFRYPDINTAMQAAVR